MSLEQMTYKMRPAGHDAPQPKRKYAAPDRKSKLLFEEWLNAVDRTKAFLSRGWLNEIYERTLDLLENHAPSPEEVHSLIASHQDSPAIHAAGVFLSAVYNKRPEKVFVFDIDFKSLNCVGFDLPAGKTLVNIGTAGHSFGYQASGNLVNMGKIEGGRFGPDMKGLAINYGKVEKDFAIDPEGTAINLGETKREFSREIDGCIIDYQASNFMHYEGPYLHSLTTLEHEALKSEKTVWYGHTKITPEIRQYFENLRQKLETGRQDYRKAVEVIKELGPQPGKRIQKDVETLLERARNVKA